MIKNDNKKTMIKTKTTNMIEMIKLQQYGEIYCLTSPSGKKYVGQCCIVDSNYRKYGTQRRWRGHVIEAKNYVHKGCWLLNKAIKKYDEINFKVEIILSCRTEKLGYYEKYFIKKYNTLRPNGYNIAFGGSQTNFLKNKVFEKKKSDDVPEYIFYFDSSNSKGYRVEHPNLPTKAFLSTVFTMNEKLEMAKKYIETGKCHEGRLPVPRKNSEENSLPKYVKSKCGGYVVEAPGKEYKSFTNKNYTVEENLAMAIEYVGTGEFTPPREWHVRNNEEDANLPKYICRYRNGFEVQLYLGNRKKIRKCFLSKNMTDEEKLGLAKIYLDDLINGTHNYKEPEKNYFKKSDLPKYIGESKNDKGYKITYHPTKTSKSFSNPKFTKEENLAKAIEFLDQLKNK